MSLEAKPKSRLGRGLSSLLSISEHPVQREVPAPETSASASPAEHGSPVEIQLDLITPNPTQPRKHIDDSAVAELATSIKSNGIIQPVVVRQVDGGYQLIAGERRLRAARLAGLAAIPAIVRQVDSAMQAQMALVENIQRKDLNPMERAESYRALAGQLGLTQAELAGRLGEDRSSVANHLRLLDLPDTVRQLIRQAKLSLGHAKILAGVSDPVEQDRLANQVVLSDMSVRALEALASGTTAGPTSARQSPARSAHLIDLERTIARQLGMKVQVRGSKKGRGRLVIQYASLDQFDQLLDRLGVKTDV